MKNKIKIKKHLLFRAKPNGVLIKFKSDNKE